MEKGCCCVIKGIRPGGNPYGRDLTGGNQFLKRMQKPQLVFLRNAGKTSTIESNFHPPATACSSIDSYPVPYFRCGGKGAV
jgi:hypothetical protein